MVSKGRIHGELGIFLNISSNSIKLTMKLRGEITEKDIYRKKTQRKIYKIKNHLIWTNIREEIKERSEDRKVDRKEREFDKISKN